ncbi:Cytoskeleton-associated protein 5 [Aphelenchoides besseyi]|nr:Cytoskeleton-associated protein 5 [Aphelenchoides besseyi]
MDFATPYDILRHAKEEFYENLQSKKWNERKEAIGKLVDIMDKNPRLTTDDASGHHRLVGELTKILKQDANINVAATAAMALTRLARGSGVTFRPHSPDVISTCLTRLKEVKPTLRDPCIECLDACHLSSTFDSVLPCIKEGLAMKAPGSKLQTCEFFTRVMLNVDFQTAKKSSALTKEIVEELCKLALGSDATCREGAMKSLAAFLRAVGKQVGMPLLGPVAEDKLKMAKVDEYFEQFASEVPKEETTQSTSTETKADAKKPETANNSVPSTNRDKQLSDLGKLSAEVAAYEFLTPYDVLKHTNEDFYNELQSKKWSERRDAMGNLVEVMDKNPRLTTDDASGHHRLVGELTKILKQDANINVAATAAMALTRLARGSGVAFRPHSPDVISTCLTRLKEVKPTLRDPCIECLDACHLSSTFDSVLPCIKEGLAMKAPGSKLQTCEFFTRVMLNVDFQTAKKSAPTTKEIVEELCKLALGSDATCRDGAMKSLAAFLRAVGKQNGMSLLGSVAEDKLKMAKVDEYFEQFAAKQTVAEEKPKQTTSKTETTAKQETARKPETIAKQETPEPVEQIQPKAPEPQIVETPMVRALNQASSEMFQQMRTIVSDDLASMPLESLLNLNHVYPRKMSNVPIDSVLAEQIGGEELASLDPKTVISEALSNLNSAQLVSANSAIVALMALAQDSLNQKLMAEKAFAILSGIITKFHEVSETYTGSHDSEEFVCQASNFLLKFVPQRTVASKIDKPLFKAIVGSLLNISASCGEGNSQKSTRHLLHCFSEHADVNVIIFSALEMAADYINPCLIEESNNPDFDYRKMREGHKLHHVYLLITRALEHCESNVERRNELDVYSIHVAFRNLCQPIYNPTVKLPPKSNVKSSTFYVLQKFVKTTMIKSMITAVRLDEKTKHSDYVIKTHRGLLTRELATHGEEKLEQMLCGYTHRLVQKFSDDHDFKFALESLYAIYKHCLINQSFGKLRDVFDKTIRASGFAPVIEDTLEKMDQTYMKGEDMDVDQYLFSQFVTGSTLDLYRMTAKLSKMMISAPNVQEIEELEFESEFVNRLREFGRENTGTGTSGLQSRLDDFGTTLQNQDPNRTYTFRTPEKNHQMSEEETLSLFRTVVKPKRTSGVPAVKIPAQMYNTVQRHLENK